VLTSDACALDVSERVKRYGLELSFSDLGRLLGCSRQSAHRTLKRALEKQRREILRRARHDDERG